ncbi:DUF2244 domain-containing protein [Ovoidimarina sediminis]|uniref:DUF2244 domain-containing protein n=1 Tax=Ovoidimarina sediminis TaxID=3079856 RepID=UPI00291240A0|nr:DUF2244 domain-containing protein [Rhodophyticola sp. MJ-SS7]MDU8942647.1 DUF2244 domain-containing protein [Rhodophyticola sp. MJ-SS7]
MPYRWSDTQDPRTLTLTPHQSMTPGGFVAFMSVTLLFIAVPLLSVLGTPILWGLLPFFGAALWGLWAAINRNRRDAALRETLTISHDRMELVREDPRKGTKRWEANPYWVSVHLHPGDKPVENYLTLKGAGREVELGAFLSPEERAALKDDVLNALAAARTAP